jgi:hypothetical protein
MMASSISRTSCARANVEAIRVVGRNELSVPPINDTVDEASSLLFCPVDRLAIQRNLVEADLVRRYEDPR